MTLQKNNSVATDPKESERIKKIVQANANQRQAEVDIIISEKIELKAETIRKDKNHCMMINSKSYNRLCIYIHIYRYAPNIRASHFIKQTLLELRE